MKDLTLPQKLLVGALTAALLAAGWALWQAYGLPVLLLSAFMLC